MTFSIKTSSGRLFEQRPDESILVAAENAGLIFSYSCRTGRCSACKCRLVSGEASTSCVETGLSDAEKEDGWILSCVRTVTTDATIEIEDLSGISLPEKMYPCRISEITRMSPDVNRVILRLPPAQKFDVLAGQYIDLIGPKGIMA